MVAGFAFAMLGFLAAIITILFAFVHSETFKAYKRVGYLDILFYMYKVTILCLIFTAAMSLFGFASTDFIWPFRLMLIFFVINLFQVAYITITISNLAHKAGHETE
ncbi:hypothetical protein KAR91_32280 [Candidatus Pacearchaeota archaeon]|nr:hypothetical protein [Candidatus Pacearchaeota archaeon]